MKPSTVALVVLGVAGAGAALYFLVLRKGTPAASATRPRPAASAGGVQGVLSRGGNVFNALDRLQGAGIAAVISSKIPIPAGLRAPVVSGATAFVKYATPIGVTGLAVNAVAHPVDSVKAVATAPVKAASSVVHAIGSIF